jgi:hypothetical protein
MALLLAVGTVKGFAQKLKSLIPDAATVQFAGSIGFISVGAGYELFHNKRGNLDFTYGYVPASKGGTLHIIATKFAYRPFKIKIKDVAKFYPLNPGLFISYTINKDLPIEFNKSQYEKGYYWWSPALRPHLSFSSEVELDTEKDWNKSQIESISIYAEVNTNDYYAINYIHNPNSLSIGDIFQVGLGLRVKF